MNNINRRQFLKRSGSSLALPFLASLHSRAFAKEKIEPAPQKMVFLCFGWGITKETWYPDAKISGLNYELSQGLQPLKRHKKDFTIIQNMEHKFCDEGHWGSTLYLTGANLYSVPGKSFSNTVSVDQVAAQQWGKNNRYTSLQFDCKNPIENGHGPGLSASWNQAGKPMQGINNPLAMYNHLFGQDQVSYEDKKQLITNKRSSLDVFLLDIKRIEKKLTGDDKDKLDEYLQSVRTIETQLEKQIDWIDTPKPKSNLSLPTENISGYEEIKLMYDLIVSALQTDSTRVITYRQPVDILLKSFGITTTAHNMTHYDRGTRWENSKFRDQKQSELLAYFFDRMKNTKDTWGQSLFDTTTISYGSNISHGHNVSNCPAIVAGNSQRLKLGRQLIMPDKTPLCNLWLTLLKANEIEQVKFGDSNGLIEDLLT